MPRPAITCHEEVRDTVLALGNRGTVTQIVEAMAISPTTARRYLHRLVAQGWATTRTENPGRGRPVVIYTMDPARAGDDWTGDC